MKNCRSVFCFVLIVVVLLHRGFVSFWPFCVSNKPFYIDHSSPPLSLPHLAFSPSHIATSLFLSFSHSLSLSLSSLSFFLSFAGFGLLSSFYSLSLSHTHTHTHTHSLSLSLLFLCCICKMEDMKTNNKKKKNPSPEAHLVYFKNCWLAIFEYWVPFTYLPFFIEPTPNFNLQKTRNVNWKK